MEIRIFNCVKEFQLKAENYISVIEWIQFNRLDNMRKISEEKYTATWLDGSRIFDVNFHVLAHHHM